MRTYTFKMLGITTISALLFQSACAQNTAPYWSLAGNSNASTTPKLGTTNRVDLQLYTNNLERLRLLSSNGFIGIGTTLPTSRLQVNSATGISPLKCQINNSTKLYMSGGGGLSVGSGTAAPSNGLYVAGKVGIGITGPVNELQVAGRGLFTKGISITDSNLYCTNPKGTAIEGYGGSYSTGVFGSGYTGVYGYSSNGAYGIYGISSNAYNSNGCAGVYGSAYYGIYGNGANTGVYGTAAEYGVHGRASGAGSTGLYGVGGSIGVSGFNSFSAYGALALRMGTYDVGVYGAYSSNSATAWAGYFEGNVYCAGIYQGSDQKLKENISDFTNAINIINKLKPKTYEYKHDENYTLMNLPKGTHYGLVAQDVEQVLPNLVRKNAFETKPLQIKGKKDSTMADGTGTNRPSETINFKAVNYTELIPILVKAMQEQSKVIEELKKLNGLFSERLQKVEAVQSKLPGVHPSTICYLEQNTPNPVHGTSAIRYQLPKEAPSGKLLLTNSQGQVVKAVEITNHDSGQVNIDTRLLAAGTYTYSLLVNNNQVDSKHLVVVR